MISEEQRDWISNAAPVVVENPVTGDRWEGRAIAIADHPTIIVELADCSRVSRPLAWARASEHPIESTPRNVVHLCPRAGQSTAPCCAPGARAELLRQDHDRRGEGHLPRRQPMSELDADARQAERRRTRPFVSFYTTKLYDPEDWPDVRDEREWDVQSAEGGPCGGSFPDLATALVCARLLALQHVLRWELRSSRGRFPDVSVCWCGWTEPLAGCHANDITAHVITAHPDHPVVRG